MAKMPTPFPEVPLALLEHLEKTEQSPNWLAQPDLAMANYIAGKNYIIHLLRTHYERQQKTITR